METLIALGALIVLVFLGVVIIHLVNGQRADLIATHRFWRKHRDPAGATPTDGTPAHTHPIWRRSQRPRRGA